MSTTNDLKKLAALLSCPEGDEGAKLGERMDQDNFSMTSKAFEVLNLSPGSHLLELGHGQAGHLEKLLPPEIFYTGLEISKLMYEMARKKNAQLVEQARAHFYLFDGKTFEFDEGTFDACLTVNTLYFWQDLTEMFQSIKKVLKPGGSLVLVFADKEFMQGLSFTKHGFHLYSCKEIQESLKRAGFTTHQLDKSKEDVKSKTGEQVERVFWTLQAVQL